MNKEAFKKTLYSIGLILLPFIILIVFLFLVNIFFNRCFTPNANIWV